MKKMKKWYNKKLFIIFSVIGLAVIIGLYQIRIMIFEVRTFPERETIIKERVFPGEKIIISYRHSIAKTIVWEIYEVTNDMQLVQRETDFYDCVAGMPYVSFGDEQFVQEDGKFKIKNMNRIINLPLYYNVGAIRENYLYIKDKKINLSSLTGDQLVTIELKRCNLWEKYLYDM